MRKEFPCEVSSCLNLVAWRNYFQFCLAQSFNNYGDPGRNSLFGPPNYHRNVTWNPNFSRLPAANQLACVFARTADRPCTQKSSNSYATFCNIDQPSFGGGVPRALSWTSGKVCGVLGAGSSRIYSATDSNWNIASANIFKRARWFSSLCMGGTWSQKSFTCLGSSRLAGTRICIAWRLAWLFHTAEDLKWTPVSGVGEVIMSYRWFGKPTGCRLIKSSAATHTLWISNREWKLNEKPCTANKTSIVSAMYRSCRGVTMEFLAAMMSNLAKRSRRCNVPSSIALVRDGSGEHEIVLIQQGQVIKSLARFPGRVTFHWNHSRQQC